MAKIRNHSRKATVAREQVRRFRRIKKIQMAYEKRVESELRAMNWQSNEDDRKKKNQNSVGNVRLDAKFDLKESLRTWVSNHRISKVATNDLLQILNSAGFNSLPKDGRTLMQTPVQVDIYPMGTGKFWYGGIKKGIERLFKNLGENLTMHLDFNFDGMPVFKSSKICFWPMLCSARGEIFRSS